MDVTDCTDLGTIPMTYSAGTEAYCSACYEVEVDDRLWTVQLILSECPRIKLFIFGSNGDSGFSRVTYAPNVQLGAAIRNALRLGLLA